MIEKSRRGAFQSGSSMYHKEMNVFYTHFDVVMLCCGVGGQEFGTWATSHFTSSSSGSGQLSEVSTSSFPRPSFEPLTLMFLGLIVLTFQRKSEFVVCFISITKNCT